MPELECPVQVMTDSPGLFCSSGRVFLDVFFIVRADTHSRVCLARPGAHSRWWSQRTEPAGSEATLWDHGWGISIHLIIYTNLMYMKCISEERVRSGSRLGTVLADFIACVAMKLTL